MQEFPHQGHSGAWNKYAKPYVPVTTADLHLTWDVAYEPGTIKVIGRKNGKQVVEEIHTTGKAAALRVSVDTTGICANGSDVVLAHVDVVDYAGNVVPDADNQVNFTMTGPGGIIGVDNGNSRDDSSFKLNYRKAFNGHVFAVVQAGRIPGDITVTVQADGLKPASLTIVARKQANNALDFEELK